MTARSYPIRQGTCVMNSSFSHGTDFDIPSSLMERDNLIQVHKYLPDGSCNVGRCQKFGCNEVVAGHTVFCKSHTSGQWCQMLGCHHIVSNGLALCMSHRGGRPSGDTGSSIVVHTTPEALIKNEGDGFRNTGNGAYALSSAEIYNAGGEVAMCKHAGCSKRAQKNAMCCKVHSGISNRCKVQGCTKGAHGGTPLCIGHGGGKRCVVDGCPNAACGSSQGRSDCCVRHGGGRRCNYDGCGKGAQGNTDFCIAHGGGRRCKYEGCGKSAQGRTDYCIKHGGGRRCKIQGCSASAKWGKDFCSVHRKSLSRNDLGNEETHPPPAKRRTKKAKVTAETSASSRQVITVSVIPGSGMPKMTAASSEHDKLPESLIMKHATVAHVQPLSPQLNIRPWDFSCMASTDNEAAVKDCSL